MQGWVRVLGLTVVAAGLALADEKKSDCCEVWVTTTLTQTVCSTPVTYVPPCASCTPQVVTCPTQPITTVCSSATITSTYCPTPGVYTIYGEVCTVTQPQHWYYSTPCEVQYVCPYDEWTQPVKHVTQIVYIQGEEKTRHDVEWKTTTTSVTTYVPKPTIIVVNNVSINVSVAPTYVTYVTSVVATSTVTSTVVVTGSGTALPTGTATGTLMPTGTATGLPTGSVSGTNLPTGSASGTNLPTGSASGTNLPTGTATALPTGTTTTGPIVPSGTPFILTTNDGSEVITLNGGDLVFSPVNGSMSTIFSLSDLGNLLVPNSLQAVLLSAAGLDTGANSFHVGSLSGFSFSRLRARDTGDIDRVYGFGPAMSLSPPTGEDVIIQRCGDALKGGAVLASGCVTANVISANPLPTSTSGSGTATATATATSSGMQTMTIPVSSGTAIVLPTGSVSDSITVTGIESKIP